MACWRIPKIQTSGVCVLEAHDHDVVLEIIVITFAVNRTNSQLGNSAKWYRHRSRTQQMHSNKSDKLCVCARGSWPRRGSWNYCHHLRCQQNQFTAAWWLCKMIPPSLQNTKDAQQQFRQVVCVLEVHDHDVVLETIITFAFNNTNSTP